VTTSTYGADEHGLICGFAFRPAAPGEPIGSADAVARIQGHVAAGGGGFVWLHFNLSNAHAEAWLRRHAGLDEEFFDALREGSRSSRIERDGDTLFAVINDVTFDFDFDASDLATLWVSARDGVVVSARRHPLRSIDRLRAAVRRGEPLDSPVALLDHLLRDQADELQRIARVATARVDEIEDALLAGKASRHGAELARLRRLMVRLQRWLAPEPGALMRMLGNPPGWVTASDTQRLRQASEDFAVVLRDIGDVQERIKLLQEEASARVAEENNRSLFMLTMVTVLALPINLVAGLLGMNVGGIPLAEHPHGFWLVVLLIAVFTLGVAGLAMRRIGRRE
jgi:zinc transporter